AYREAFERLARARGSRLVSGLSPSAVGTALEYGQTGDAMTQLRLMDPLFPLSGFIVGQTGMGGGALMTPILVLLFGVHPATAVGTDLLYASATKTAGTLVHGL